MMKNRQFILLIIISYSTLLNAQTYLGTNSYASTVDNSLPNQAAIEIRELNRGGQQLGEFGEAPSIGFHWAQRNWGHFLLGADGKFRLMNADRSTYSSLFVDQLLTTGRVGIGTINPQANLDINGSLKITSNSDLGFINLTTTSGNPKIVSNAGLFLTSSTYNVFYGGGTQVAIGSVNERTGFGILNILGSNVGIGTTNPDQKLTVKGKIHAEEVIIDLNVPVADYVFAENYPLMPLHKVEQFVKINNHLPEIPSATEVKEKGLSLGEMQNKLLQKIEELTLYVIEQQKINEKQGVRIEELEKKVK